MIETKVLIKYLGLVSTAGLGDSGKTLFFQLVKKTSFTCLYSLFFKSIKHLIVANVFFDVERNDC